MEAIKKHTSQEMDYVRSKIPDIKPSQIPKSLIDFWLEYRAKNIIGNNHKDN